MDRNSDRSIPHRLPCHRGAFVDGRSGWQWIKSVEHYLAWRAGDCWRPVGHRFHVERVYYSDALRTLKRAYFRHPDVQAWHAPSTGELARIEFVACQRSERERRDRLRLEFPARKGPQPARSAAVFLLPARPDQLRLFA